MPTYTLHTPDASFRAFKALIAAEYNGISITIPKFDASKVSILSPTGKAPVLETPSGNIFESNSIARYISRLRRDTGLAGNGSVLEEATVDSWIDFCVNEIEIPACVWWYPAAGYMPFFEEAYEKAKKDLSKGLETINKHLLAKTYLVGEKITLADIVIASTLVYPIKFVCDKVYLKPFGNVLRWFNTCMNQSEFKAVIGEVTICKKELKAADQEVPKLANKQENVKQEKGADKKSTVSTPAPAQTKAIEHPYKVMDRKIPSNFNMDAWKKTYSNCDTYEKAMETFWSTFDSEGWSLWHQHYNYNDENKRVFMTSNAVGGFQQRSDEIRKWAFGVMHVLGTEEISLEIQGIWLLRGDTVEHMVNANDDANWYTWTKLAGKEMSPSNEVKSQVAAYWCSEEDLEGKHIQDTKVFK